MKTAKNLILLIAVLICGFLAMAFYNYNTSDEGVNKIIAQFTKFHKQYPQQKIYLQTDKGKYMAGETIWIKAYLLDAQVMNSDSSSNEIFVDLLDCNQKLYKAMVLKNNGGNSFGEILLNDTIPEGNYLLRGYTSWMRNFSDNFFFTQTLTIVNPGFENVVTARDIVLIKDYNESLKQKERLINVTYFPEGGTFVCGLENTIAFKVENDNGIGVDLNGTIVDDKDNKVADLQCIHKGMGIFKLTPEWGKKYSGKFTIDGKTKKFDLPQTAEKGVVFKVDNSEKAVVRLNIQSNKELTPQNQEIIVMAQSQGKIVYMSKGSLTKPIKTSIAKKLFPAGIAQLTLFSSNGEPLCERLMFVSPKEESKLALSKESTEEEVTLHIKINAADQLGKKGNLSVAVVEKTSGSSSTSWNENILTKLLLTSDLKGKVEDPLYYFNPANTDLTAKLDLVMLTHGWRRFIWKEILDNNFPKLSFTSFEKTGFFVAPDPNPSLMFPLVRNEQYNKDKVKNNTKLDKRNNKSVQPSGNSNYYYVSEKNQSYTSILDFMKGAIAGVQISPNGIKIRGVNTFNSTDPLIMQDDSPITFSELSAIRPANIEFIEVLKGSDASLYGARGGNGVIILHSRNKQENNTPNGTNLSSANALIYSIHSAREFYQPRFETWNYKPNDFNVSKTIFWKPVLVTDTSGIAVVNFKNKFAAEKYSITIEGITSAGDIIHYSE